MSDRDVGDGDLTLDVDVELLRAVLDELALQKVVLVGGSSGGCAAIAFAARFPERVDRLLLYGAYADGTAIWGDFDAQEVFQKLGGALSIKTVNVGFAAYFEELGRVGLVTENEGKTMVNISGTKMREVLDRGEMPDARVMRPSTAKVLAEYYAQQKKS